jgi:hypothetical protein
MQSFKKIIIANLILFAVIAFCTSASSAEPVKIKGFYIGMTIDDALKNLERLGFEGLSIRENKYKKTNTYYSLRPGSGDQFRVETGLNVRTVSKIVFSAGISDRLFNTKGIGARIFKKNFTAAYGIMNMSPIKDNPGSDTIKGWEYYNLKDGYRIRIYLNKDVEITKTDKAEDFSFD